MTAIWIILGVLGYIFCARLYIRLVYREATDREQYKMSYFKRHDHVNRMGFWFSEEGSDEMDINTAAIFFPIHFILSLSMCIFVGLGYLIHYIFTNGVKILDPITNPDILLDNIKKLPKIKITFGGKDE